MRGWGWAIALLAPPWLRHCALMSFAGALFVEVSGYRGRLFCEYYIMVIFFRYPYVFGETFCIVRGFAAETSTNATVLTITAFTIERYVAICHPFLSHTESNLSRAFKYILVIWMVALTLAFPQVRYLTQINR